MNRRAKRTPCWGDRHSIGTPDRGPTPASMILGSRGLCQRRPSPPPSSCCRRCRAGRTDGLSPRIRVHLGSGARAWIDHRMARSTLTTLNRGSRSMWMSKTKPSGQLVTARRSATVLAVTGVPCSTSTLMLSRYARRSLRISSIVLAEYRDTSVLPTRRCKNPCTYWQDRSSWNYTRHRLEKP